MTVAIVDYGSGNLRSAAKALERAALATDCREVIAVTADPAVVAKASRVVLPGVGAFGACREGLAALDGMVEALEETALKRGQPFLGICVGMQLMADCGREHGVHKGLGWLPGEVLPLVPTEGDLAEGETTEGAATLKVPHMGWNDVAPRSPVHPLFEGLADGSHFYFVHGYYFRHETPDHLLASVDYGGRFAAAVGRNNLVGTQFHPEKSQAAGLRLLGNFLRWTP
ncbi:MAG TPA: imidazole glycerol phosphate synthase subunit HisH [Kiloniellaceae bacterium]|nr:imidazole glycerol phosphate synthase subunit HisH [Kiloniellaceae bacterium]